MGVATRKLSQRSHMLVLEIKRRAEELARSDRRVVGMRDASLLVPRRYVDVPPPVGQPLLSEKAIERLYKAGDRPQ
jgi:hypothetical protein